MDLKLWINAFTEIAKQSNQLSIELATELAKSNTMKRFFYKAFDSIQDFPSFEDFTVSIAIEFLDQENKSSIEYIISYSDAVYDKWVENIINDDNSREYLQKIGKSPFEIRGKQKEYRALASLIENKTDLRKSFFKSYNKLSLESYVKVYLPNNEGIIDWKDEWSINIMVNPFKGFELGFFRVGYDYKYSTGESLSRVTYSDNDKLECAMFGSKEIGKVTDNHIWLR